VKNIRMLAIGLVAGAALATSATAFAGPALEKITATLRPDYKVVVDGKQVELKNAPISYNGTTYIPLREAGEILGRTVGFQDGTITIDQQPAETGGKDDGQMTTSVAISGRELVNLLGEKYPDLSDPANPKITLDANSVLNFNGQKFQLQKSADGLLDVTPLIEADIIDSSDIQ